MNEGNASQLKPAGFWVRLVALGIDSFILGFLLFIVLFISGMIQAISHGSQIVTIMCGLFTIIFSILIPLLYFIIFTAKSGQTLGKKAMNVKVENSDGGPVGWGKAIGRYFSTFLSSLILCIGYLMAAFDQEKKALHDRLAGTKVVQTGPPSVVAIVLFIVFLGGSVVVGGILAAVAIPSFMKYKNVAQYSLTKSNLQNLRTAVAIYYADKMAWPKNLQASDFAGAGKYIDEVPAVKLESLGYPASSQVESYPFLDSSGNVDPAKLKNTGHWLYDPAVGKVIVDSTGNDKEGNPVYTW